MVDWTTRVVTVRTTREGAGRAYDVVTGSGTTPDQALNALKANATEAAQRIGQRMAKHIDPESLFEGFTPRESAHKSWEFEVVDVRLTPGPIKGGDRGWLAYGTLTRGA